MIYTPVKIDGVDVASAFGFYCVDRVLSNPKLKTNYIEVPNMNGSIDASEAAGLFYEDRDLALKFVFPELIAPDTAFSALSNFAHGKKHRIVFDDDQDWYYVGRIFLDDMGTDRILTGSARVFPYKLAVTEKTTTQEAVSGGIQVMLRNDGEMTVVPKVTTTEPVTISDGENSTAINAGTYRISWLTLTPGVRYVTIDGSGTVTFEYREAKL